MQPHYGSTVEKDAAVISEWVAMQPNADVSLPPFAGALSLLDPDAPPAKVDVRAIDPDELEVEEETEPG